MSGGSLAYSISAANTLSEVVKLGASIAIFAVVWLKNRKKTSNGANVMNRALLLRYAAYMMVPCLLWSVANYLAPLAMMFIDATMFSLLMNARIVSVSILFRILMKKKLSIVQWCSLGLILLALSVSQLAGSPGSTPSTDSSYGVSASNMLIGIGIMVVFVGCLSVASVVTEKIMKTNGQSVDIYVSTIVIHSWTVLFNFIALIGQDLIYPLVMSLVYPERSFAQRFSLHKNWNYAAIVGPLFGSANGIANLFTLQFANSIVALFANSCSVIIVAVASLGKQIINTNGTQVNIVPSFWLSSAILLVSIFIYVKAAPAEDSRPAQDKTYQEMKEVRSTDDLMQHHEGENTIDQSPVRTMV